MRKRLLYSLSQNINIKLIINLINDTNLLYSKVSHYNLRSISEMKKTISPENTKKANMTINKSDCKSEINIKYLDTPVKSESDKKDYRVIKLENGLTALLISDLQSNIDEDGIEAGASSTDNEESESSEETESDCTEENESNKDKVLDDEDIDHTSGKAVKRDKKMAACGLCVGVGSFSDPIEIQGLAHFLEHMVFMGSEKYPMENDFDTFIKLRGGFDNASTDCEHTTFYFEIQEKYLLPAMERFAQFFISPLMKRDAITREREAVESEFKMALPSDSNRKEQLFCSFARKDHPAAKFPWGNLITLRDNIDEDKLYSELHKFRERHYSAHRMTLAVQARLPLDELEQYVKSCFSSVPVNNLPSHDFSKFIGKDSFNTPEFRKLYKIKSIKDISQVELTWVSPPLHHLYKSKPHQYVSWIIGHEGKGSLINFLRKKMWCLDIFTGNSEGGFEHSSMYALFNLTLTLTDEGYEHFNEVLDSVFSYINLLKREGPQKRIFDEIQQIERINFRFTGEDNPVYYVEALCENMHFYPPIDYITGCDLYFEYDPTSIKNCIDSLSPDNVNIILFDKKFNEDDFDKVEPWFQTKYACSEIPKEWVMCWKKITPLSVFHLPKPNMYITDDFSLIDLPDNIPKYPVKIHDDEKIEIWYRVDQKFRLPNCYIYLYLITPFAIESPKSSAMLKMLVSLLEQLLVEDLYNATVAELEYHISSCIKGIMVKVHGLNHKLFLLLKTIIKSIADCHKLATEKLFNVMKREQLKSYYNTFVKPSKLANDIRISILTKGFWTSIEKYDVISDVTFDDFINFSKNWTDRMYIQCLVQGNVSQENVLKNIFECIKPLQYHALLPKSQWRLKLHEIPIGEKCCRVKNFNSMDVNSIVTNYYQSNLASINLYVMIEFLMMFMEEPLFHQLRTQEQLGYDVSCLLRDTYGVVGYSITVCTQADKFTTEYIDKRIEEFIKSLSEYFKEKNIDEYNFIKESLIKSKQCTDIDLKEEVNRNWTEITEETYIFDRYDKEISAIKSITIDQLIEWLNDHIIDGKNFRKLSIQVVGTANKDKENKNDEKTLNPEAKKYSLLFLTDDKKSVDYYITDIQDYKSKLNVLPDNHTTL